MKDSTQITELWELFQGSIQPKDRASIARDYIDWLLANDVPQETIEAIAGYDPHLDDAITVALEDNDEFTGADDDDINLDDENIDDND